ncbi:36370_t:CDS:1, partial [Gigaspora margarita]
HNSVFIGFNKLPGCSLFTNPLINITTVKDTAVNTPSIGEYKRYFISIKVDSTNIAQEIIFKSIIDVLGNNTCKESPMRITKGIVDVIVSNVKKY